MNLKERACVPMAVFKTTDSKEMILSCKCGCDEGIRVRIEQDNDSYSYITYLSGNWYKEQGHFRDKLKKIWAILRSKDYCYSEVILDKKDWNDFKEWINQY